MNDKRNDRRKATKFDKRSMLAAATNAFGDIKDWQPDDLKSASSLVTMMKPRDLKELDAAVVSVQRTAIKRAFHFNRTVAKRSVFYCLHIISFA